MVMVNNDIELKGYEENQTLTRVFGYFLKYIFQLTKSQMYLRPVQDLLLNKKCMKQIFCFPNIEKLYHSKNNCISKD